MSQSPPFFPTHAKLHLNVFIVSASGGQKPHFWTNFDIWGLLYRPSFTDEGRGVTTAGDTGDASPVRPTMSPLYQNDNRQFVFGADF